MKLLFGTPGSIFKRDFAWYLSIQVVIWVKVLFTFFLFGVGIAYSSQPVLIHLPFVFVPAFGNSFHVWEWVFHQIMHVGIALWVFLLAKHVQKIKWIELASLFLVAVVLHNIGYWLTSTHPSLEFSARDFLLDYFALWGFFLFFLAMIHFLPRVRKMKIPFFE
jgi:hypothetical protein